MSAATTVRLTLEYDGSAFSGWQRQRDVRTVEGVLRAAVVAVTGADAVALTAAGRTDAGAHAHGQVVGLTLRPRADARRGGSTPTPASAAGVRPDASVPPRPPPGEPQPLRLALHAVLPRDVVVVAADGAPHG